MHSAWISGSEAARVKGGWEGEDLLNVAGGAQCAFDEDSAIIRLVIE
jgi:hypothetical protein